MNYISLKHHLYETPRADVHYSWTLEDNNCFWRHIASRVGNLALAPWSIMTQAVDTVIGIGAALATIGTLGNKKIYQVAIKHLDSASFLIADPYLHLLKTINPNASLQVMKGSNNKLADPHLTTFVGKNMLSLAKSCWASKNKFVHHVCTRLTFALLALSCVITRVIDLIIGVVAAIGALVTLGTCPKWNRAAYMGLQITGIIQDLFEATIRIVNPSVADE